jgi:hypothetical protein
VNTHKKKTAKRARRHTGESLEDVMRRELPPAVELQIAHPFQHRWHLSQDIGTRAAIYASIAFFLVVCGLAISLVNPWALLGVAQPLEQNSVVRTSVSRVLPLHDLDLPDDGTLYHQPEIILSGRVKGDRALSVNDAPVALDPTGYFVRSVRLHQGENVIVLHVRGADEDYVLRRIVYYEPVAVAASVPLPEPGSEVPAPAREALTLQVHVYPEPTWVEVTVDRVPQPRLDLSAGSTYTWRADESISVRTGNAASTVVWLNNRDLGVLSPEPRELMRTYTWGDVR